MRYCAGQLIWLCLALSAFGQPFSPGDFCCKPPPPPPAGINTGTNMLMAWWPLDADGNDVGGFNNNLTACGSTAPTFQIGFVTNCAAWYSSGSGGGFTGSGLPTVPIYRAGSNFSVAFWYKAATPTPFTGFPIYTERSTAGDYFEVSSLSGQTVFTVTYSNALSGVGFVNQGTAFNGWMDGNWHQFALVDSNKVIRVYYDSVVDVNFNSAAPYTGSLPALNTVNLGGDATGCYMFGYLDDVRAYRTNLWPGDVTNLYTNTVNNNNPLLQGLVAWYKFDETTGVAANDSSGNGNTAYASNTVTRIQGRTGNAWSFNASNPGYFNAVDSASLQSISNAGTLSYWLKFNAPSATMGFVGKGNYMTGAGTNAVGSGPTTTTFYGLLVGDGAGQNNLAMPGGVASVGYGAWQHICSTWDVPGSYRAFYLNGTLNSSSSSSPRGYVNSPGTPLRIGAGAGAGAPPAGLANYASAQIDEVRLYSRALAAGEVSTLYNYTATNLDLTSGMQGYWKFDESSGKLMADSSGNGNTLTNNDASSPSFVAGHLNNCIAYAANTFPIITNAMAGVPVFNNSSGYSVSLWVKCTAGANAGYLYLETGPVHYWGILADSSGKVSLSIYNGTFLLNNVLSTTIVMNGNWRHLVWTDSGGSGKLYIDKVLDATSFNYASSALTLPTGVGVGCSPPRAQNFHAGSIDEVRVYNVVLTTNQIAALFNL